MLGCERERRHAGRRAAAMWILVALVVATFATSAAGDSLTITWAPGVAAPAKRSEAGSAVVGGKLYLFGGYFSGFVPSPRVDVYDPASRTWTRLPDMPEGITHMGVATDGTYVYIAGGYLPKLPKGQIFASDHVWRFDPAGAMWTSMPALPSPRGGGALVLLGRVLHYFGGSNIHRHDAATHWTFDVDTDTLWHKAAALPNARNHLGGVELGGLVYAVGGQHLQDASAVPQDEVDVWSPVTKAWTVAAALPTPRSHVNASTTTFWGHLVVVGGDITANTPTSQVDSFDPTTGTWSVLDPLPGPVYASVAADLGTTLVSTTGATPTKTASTYEATRTS